jgi:hypothetical protein
MRIVAAIVAACAALATAVVATDASVAAPSIGNPVGAPNVDPTTGAPFDLATGNAAFAVIYPRVGPLIRQYVSPKAMDGTLVLRISALMETAWFDATAPYHATAVGIHTDLGRRPASELTNQNLNVAMLYSTYRVLNSLMPGQQAQWREMLTSVGLNPDDNSVDRRTAVGLGNLAGAAVMKMREHDGMNQLGDEGGQQYNRQPYADTTGYQPVNTATEIKDPSRWQPAILTNGNGLFTTQKFVTPQIAKTRAYTFRDVTQLKVAPPTASNFQANPQAYKAQADDVISVSAHLTDEQKMIAEFFNDKLLFASDYPDLTGGRCGRGVSECDGPALLEFIQQAATVHIASFDSQIAAFYNKVLYDAVRPFTAIHYIYGDRKITAWGGPGKGTVTDLPASQWRSYLDVADHPEYPSGTNAFCASQAEVGKRWLGTEKIDVTAHFPKGSSYQEPGYGPTHDVTLHWGTWSELRADCANSRVYGGVHFRPATAAAQEIGAKVGDLAYDFVQSFIHGKRIDWDR